MNVLLTGGAGYIGSHAALELIDKNHNVTIIDSLVSGYEWIVPNKAIFHKCDIADKKLISKILNSNKFDLVMHFAAFSKVGESVSNPKKYYDNNYEKSKIFLDTCLENEVNSIIFSSSCSVYGNVTEQKKIAENCLTKPINPYSDSKLMFEKYLLDLSSKKKLNAIILRYFNVAGADKKLRSGLMTNSENLIKAICEVATKKREKLIINGNTYKTFDGTAVRDFIHVSDLAEIHVLAGEKILNEKKTDIFNCGYGEGFSIKQVVDCFNKIKKINYEYGPERKGDAEYSVADTSKFNKNFKWSPKFNNLEIILKSAYNWEKKLKK